MRTSVLRVPFTQDAEVLANVASKKWNILLPIGVFTQHCQQDQRICVQISVHTFLRVLCELGLADRISFLNRVRKSLNFQSGKKCKHMEKCEKVWHEKLVDSNFFRVSVISYFAQSSNVVSAHERRKGRRKNTGTINI